MRTKRLLIILSLIVILIVLSAGLYFLAPQGPKSQERAITNRIKIKDFNGEGLCAAIMPSCGYCPGEEKSGGCYVTQEQFDEYKGYYSELEAEG